MRDRPWWADPQANIIGCVLALLLSIAWDEASATDYPVYYVHASAPYNSACIGGSHPAWQGQTVQASCNDTLSFFQAAKGCLFGDVAIASCSLNTGNGGAFVQVFYNGSNQESGTTPASCPYGGTVTNVSGSWMCVNPPSCPAGETRNPQTGVCEVADPCAGTNGQTSRVTFFAGYDTNGDGVTDDATAVSTPQTAADADGCNGAIQDSSTVDFQCVAYQDAPTKIYCSANYTLDGTTAPQGTTQTTTPNATNPCPSGQTLGTVNDIPRCLASGTAPSTTQTPTPTTTSSTTSTVTNGDGSTTTTTTTTNGTGTSTTVTNCTTPGNCSSTTTTTQSGAATGQAGNSDGAQFCRDNPTAAQCQPGPDYDVPAFAEPGTQAVGSGGIVQKQASAGSCPAPIQLPHGAEFDYEAICDAGVMMRPLVIAMAWLSAGLIVIGAFKE